MKSGRIRTLTRMTFANPASAVYLALVGGAVAVAVTQPLLVPDADASFIWVWPALFTFPTFGFAAWLDGAVWGGEAPMWLFTGGIAASALLQSLALGATLETLRSRRRMPTAG
jgi:hypothetical protein